MLDIILAFSAGVLTIAAPCVLPMLPIILGASVGHDRIEAWSRVCPQLLALRQFGRSLLTSRTSASLLPSDIRHANQVVALGPMLST